MKLFCIKFVLPLLIPIYFSTLLAGLYFIEWQWFSPVSFVVVLYLALFIADFVSGLVHLYIDYRPLNYEKRYNELFFYQGDRSSEEFVSKKREIVQASTWFDKTVYHFKVHHQYGGSCLTSSYTENFYQTIVPAALCLFDAIVLITVFEQSSAIAHWSFGLLIFSVAVLHTDIIHFWVHGSKTMPWGVTIVKIMQKIGMMYPVETHNRHHEQGDSGFCFITGHANFIVDYICHLLLRRNIIHRGHWFGEQ